MEIINKKILLKLRRKKIGNTQLVREIDKLIKDFENAEWNSEQEIYEDRSDADRVHSEGFYFFNIHIHRTMVLISVQESDVRIIWAGSHEDYDSKFQNNKKTIEKWLRSQNEIK